MSRNLIAVMQTQLKKFDDALKDFHNSFLWETDTGKAIERILSLFIDKIDIIIHRLKQKDYDSVVRSIEDIDQTMLRLSSFHMNRLMQEKFGQLKEDFEDLYGSCEKLKKKSALALVSGKEIIGQEFTELKQILKAIGERCLWLYDRKLIKEKRILRSIRDFVKESKEYPAAVNHIQHTLEDEHELLTIFDSLTKMIRFVYSDLSEIIDGIGKYTQPEVSKLARELRTSRTHLKNKWNKIISLVGVHLEKIARQENKVMVMGRFGEGIEGIALR